MRALVCGASGFIGKNLIEYLKTLEIDYDVVGRDWSVPLDKSYNFVFYLAGEVRKAECMWDANVNLLYKMLCRFLHMEGCIFVYIGSSSEYGRISEPAKESNPIKPTNLYDATKGMGTLLCQGFAKQFNKHIVIVRPSSVYGKYERPEKFIPTVIRNFVNHNQVDVYSGSHDWVHVDDFLSAVFAILEVGELNGNIYNISSGTQWLNEEVARIIRNTLSTAYPFADYSTLPFILHTTRLHAHDTDYWTVDNSKIKELGWSPKYDIFTGLEKTVKAIVEGM